ncbi:MAG: bifunctional (p)ppGpp synthetase/guanosine-3',5'-bis(diphosphate) 3'-pyrophosphohydrolase [Bacteroidia bacterium]|nr:bifunctional (p)ppGpp synthetase/guanosine-3',5'-bis(diphosphate) 3'-pyrophosphohydrolase [Bacteroidia bacterium]
MIIRNWTSDYKELRNATNNFVKKDNIAKLHQIYKNCDGVSSLFQKRSTNAIKIAYIAVDEIGLGNSAVIAILLYPLYAEKKIDSESIEKQFGNETAVIVGGLNRIQQLYTKTSAMESENFRKLLLTFAEDVRVIFIMLSERLFEMRNLKEREVETQQNIARETAYLYAPMAHRMGLYRIKTELEDLSLKFTAPDTYKNIAQKLSETKRSRDAYIERFIRPLNEKVAAAGLSFDIKGRTKSIYSIWNKIKKQNTTFENIYDLFAIRIILDSHPDKEKAECWQVYSIVTDMYQPNPKRLRDWLSQPKANGYESLHTTVMGPEGKWVEVQIRTKRMDDVAEKGIAAHWKYKGLKGENSMDEWLKSLREVLENPELHGNEYMDEFKLNLYDEEVFVFTPNGDLHKLPKGATLLDFAYSIHTQIGNTCIGGKIGGKNVTLKYVLQNGDQIEVLTAPNQHPHADWINIAVTTKAKQKIRQVIKEYETKEANNGREMLLRRFKNWKIDFDEANLSRLSKKLGFKNITDLYIDISQEKTDLLEFRESYLNLDKKDISELRESLSANTFEKKPTKNGQNDDVLIINNETKGVMYSMSKCCNPIFGDEIFGFVSVSGGIKIHRKDCPNAPQMMSRFGYRIVKAAWSEENGTQNICTLYVIGNDDLGVVTNISSLISKQTDVSMKSISINSNTGLFEGRLVLTVKNTKTLDDIIKKIRSIKGVKSVSRM